MVRRSIPSINFGIRHSRALICVALIFCLSNVANLVAQPPPVPEPEVPRVTAVAVAGTSGPVIDGRLGDSVWRSALFISNFRQKQPFEGNAPSRRTEVAFLYDDKALYVGARMYCNYPEEISAIVTRRDNSGASERIIVSLDTYHNRRTAYSFSVTAAGVRTDYYHPEDEEYVRDFSFDPVWEAETSVDSAGWTAEMRIPFSQLRFNDAAEQIWGLNINRYVPTRNEDIYWIVIPQNDAGWASRFGELHGLSDISPSMHLEVLPYVAGDLLLKGNAAEGDPFQESTVLEGRAGLDLKLGLGPNLTLNGTINPDFGQVEADPAEVNLSAFETVFSERRPFFVEDAGLFEGFGPRYFYSRRIGAAPHLQVDGDVVDAPDNSTILGAAKVTGRLPSGLSVGVLGAVTERESAEVYDHVADSFTRNVVEPATGYGVVRILQEYGDASVIGGMVTGVLRRQSPGDATAEILPTTAFTGSADWLQRFADGEFTLKGNVGVSHIAGEPAAMIRVQRSSAHYFQRPDADYVEVDSAARSLTGMSGLLEVERRSGRHWIWRTGVLAQTPGFELNDLGRLSYADNAAAWGTITYRETEPSGLLHNYSIQLTMKQNWNSAGQPKLGLIWGEAGTTLSNFWYSYLGGGGRFAYQSDQLTRGGPLMVEPGILNIWTGLNNGGAAKLRWRVHFGIDWAEHGFQWFGGEAGLEANIGDRLEVSLQPAVQFADYPRQYVTAQPGGPAETFGTRYIFSYIRQSIYSLKTRINYALSPDLTLEFYGEPFTADGRYYRFGQLPRAGASDLDYFNEAAVLNDDGEYEVSQNGQTFSFHDPDFTVLSFRSNMVLRWEWLPGSTFYAVWQQDRFGLRSTVDRAGPDDLFRSLIQKGDNRFAVKISYWWGG